MNRRLRIGFVCVEDARNVHTWSGIPFNVLTELQKRDIEVQLFSPLKQTIRYLFVLQKIISRLRKVPFFWMHTPIVQRYYARQIQRLLKENPVDVIFSTSSLPITRLQCAQPIIFWTDATFDLMEEYYFRGMSPHARKRGREQEQLSLASCAYACYASHWAASAAARMTDANKIAILPFGASFSIKHSAGDVVSWARSRRIAGNKTCNLLFIGVDWDRKGGDIAVETTRLLNARGITTKLIVAGTIPQKELPAFVTVLGFISKTTPDGSSQLAQLYREADFFIMPSKAEAAGIVFCEASAFGVPALSYATGGVPDYVVDNVNGFCLPVNAPPDRFADVIESALADSVAYETLTARAFEEYEQRLNWQTSVSKLVELAERSLKEQSA